MARIGQGLFDMQLAVIDLAALLREVADAFSTPQHTLHLTIEDGEAMLAAADRVRLRQCIENVVANALQKSPDSAAVSARFSPVASPVPIIALPISRMTARTSAKSRLMRPSLTIKSVMQATPE